MPNDIMLQFVDQIIEKAALKLPEDFVDEYRESLGAELEKRIWFMMMEEISDDSLKEMIETIGAMGDIRNISEEKKDKVVEFLRNNIEDFDEKTLKVMDSFGKEVLDSVAKLKQG